MAFTGEAGLISVQYRNYTALWRGICFDCLYLRYEYIFTVHHLTHLGM